MNDGTAPTSNTLCPDRSQFVRVWSSRFSCCNDLGLSRRCDENGVSPLDVMVYDHRHPVAEWRLVDW